MIETGGAAVVQVIGVTSSGGVHYSQETVDALREYIRELEHDLNNERCKVAMALDLLERWKGQPDLTPVPGSPHATSGEGWAG